MTSSLVEVCSLLLSSPSSGRCQEGSQRPQLSIQLGQWQAKNTPLSCTVEHPDSIYLSPQPSLPVYRTLTAKAENASLKITLVQ